MTETKVKDKFKSNLKMFKNPTYQQCHFGHHPSVKADEFILDTHITYIEGGGKKRYLKNCPTCDELFFVEYDFALNDKYGWSAIFVPVPSVAVANYLHEHALYYVDTIGWELSNYFKEPPIFPACIYFWSDEFGAIKGGKWIINGNHLNDLDEWKEWCKKNIVLYIPDKMI